MEFIPVCEPFLNGNEKKYVQECIDTGWISSSGKYVSLFEEKFAEYCGSKYAVSVVNGTTALHLALSAIQISKGDEVIIPDFTMIASAFAVCYTGAKPVFVDADRNTWNIDAEKIEAKITKKTKAIMPVSIFGNPCDMDIIMDIAQKYDLIVLEDAAESHGAVYKGKKTGNLADITAFSFFANKNITTGEGGMIVTNNKELKDKSLYYKNLCFPLNGSRNYIHDDIGFNYRMSNIHAAIGLAQVEKAEEYSKLRIKNSELYKKGLENTNGIIFQQTTNHSLNVHWMNGIVVEPEKYGRNRNELVNHLREKNIDSRLFFMGMHKQPSLLNYGCKQTNFPVTDWLSDNGLYLPSASNLRNEQIEYICEVIHQFKR